MGFNGEWPSADFFQPEVCLVGFVVGKHGKLPDPAKVKALNEWPDPQEICDIVSQHAFANYLREFIPRFVEIVQPLKPYFFFKKRSIIQEFPGG